MNEIIKEFFIITQAGITHIYNIRMCRKSNSDILLLSPYNSPVKMDLDYLYADKHTRFLLELKEMKM